MNKLLLFLVVGVVLAGGVVANGEFDQSDTRTWDYSDDSFYAKVDYTNQNIDWNQFDFNKVPVGRIAEIPAAQFDPARFSDSTKLQHAVAAQIAPNLEKFENLLDVTSEELVKAIRTELGADFDLSSVGEIVIKFDKVTGQLSGDFPTYIPAEFPAGEFVQKIVTSTVIDPVTGESVQVTSVDITRVAQDEAVSLTGVGSFTRDAATGALTVDTQEGSVVGITGTLDAAQPIQLVGDGLVTGDAAHVVYTEDGVEKIITGTFEKVGREVRLESYAGLQSELRDGSTVVRTVGYPLVVIPFGAEPIAFRGLRNRVSYNDEELFAIGRFDVQHGGSFAEGGFRVTSKADAAVFSTETGIAAGMVEYEDAHIVYEGLAGSVWTQLTFGDHTTDVAVHGGYDVESEDGLAVVARVQQKVRIGDLLAEEGIVVGDGRLGFLVVNDGGTLKTALDPNTAQLFAEINQNPAQVAFLDRELHLQVENSVTEVAASLGVVYDADVDNPSNILQTVLSPIKTHFYFGDDVETVQEIVRSTAAEDAFGEAFLGVQKLYALQRKELIGPNGEAFDASLKSFEKTKEFIKEAFPAGVDRDTTLSTFMLEKLQRIAEEVDVSNQVQGLLYQTTARNSLVEVREVLDRSGGHAGGLVQQYLRGEDETKGDLQFLFRGIGLQGAGGPYEAQQLKQFLATQFANELEYERLVSHVDPRYQGRSADALIEASAEHRIDSLRALLSLDETTVQPIESGAEVVRDTGTFSSKKLLLGSALAGEYAQAGQIQNALAVLDELDEGFIGHINDIYDDAFTDQQGALLKAQGEQLGEIRKDVQRVGFNRALLSVLAPSQSELMSVIEQQRGPLHDAVDRFEEADFEEFLSSMGQTASVLATGGYGQELAYRSGVFDSRISSMESLVGELGGQTIEGISTIELLSGAGVRPSVIDAWLTGKNVESEIKDAIALEVGAVPAPPTIETGGLGAVAFGSTRYIMTPEQQQLAQVVFEQLERSKPAARITYESPTYGTYLKEVIGIEDVAAESGSYEVSHSIDYIGFAERNFKKTLREELERDFSPDVVERIARFVDDGLSPAAVAIGAATGGFGGTFFSGATGLTGAVFGVAENVAIDALAGTVLVAAGYDPLKDPSLAMATSMAVGFGTSIPRMIKGFALRRAARGDVVRALSESTGLPEGELRQALRNVDLGNQDEVVRAVQDRLRLDEAPAIPSLDEVLYRLDRDALSDQQFENALHRSTAPVLTDDPIKGPRRTEFLTALRSKLATKDASDPDTVAAALRETLEETKFVGQEGSSGMVSKHEIQRIDGDFVRRVTEQEAFTSTINSMSDGELAAVGLQKNVLGLPTGGSVPLGGVLVVNRGQVLKTPRELQAYLDEISGAAQRDLAKAREVMGGDHVTTIKENPMGVLFQRPGVVQVELPSGLIELELTSPSDKLRILALARKLGNVEVPANVVHKVEGIRIRQLGYDLPKVDDFAFYKEGVEYNFEESGSHLIDALSTIRFDRANLRAHVGSINLKKSFGIDQPFYELSPALQDDVLRRISNVAEVRSSTFQEKLADEGDVLWFKEGGDSDTASRIVSSILESQNEIRLSLIDSGRLDIVDLEKTLGVTKSVDQMSVAEQQRIIDRLVGKKVFSSPTSTDHISDSPFRAHPHPVDEFRTGSDILDARLNTLVKGSPFDIKYWDSQTAASFRALAKDELTKVISQDEAFQRIVGRPSNSPEIEKARKLLQLLETGASDRELGIAFANQGTVLPSPKDISSMFKEHQFLTLGDGRQISVQEILHVWGSTLTILEKEGDVVTNVVTLVDAALVPEVEQLLREADNLPILKARIRQELTSSFFFKDADNVFSESQLGKLPFEPTAPRQELGSLRQQAIEELALIEGQIPRASGDVRQGLFEQQEYWENVLGGVDQLDLPLAIERGLFDNDNFKVGSIIKPHPDGVHELNFPVASDFSRIEIREDGTLNLQVFDVTGHGDDATFQMRSILNEEVLGNDAPLNIIDPDDVRKLHKAIEGASEGGAKFVVPSAVRVTPDGKLTVVNGGNKVFVFSPSGTFSEVPSNAAVLGVSDAILEKIDPTQLQLAPGSRIVVTTDGFIDTLGGGAQLGKAEIKSLMREVAGSKDPLATARLLQEGKGQYDDITFIVIDYK
jgi:hypothetical protein